jgi:predicted ATPase/class 3 adenylate cyclase
VQQIEDWLDKLGMSEYAERFAENRIDFSVLPDLTDQDLEKLGVVLGDRRKMLRAIAKLDCTSAAPSSIPPPAPKAAASNAPLTTESAGERRHVTVMFCDLVDSTGIAAKLDAEEWRDLVGAYLDAASAAVMEMGGKVAKKLGDGLMALFGYPVAQENDGERAVRAGLSILRALTELNRNNAGSGKPELVARVGLDTGPAVVDATGEIYGDVANIASRVQALTDPGSVVITARVQRQIAGLFVAQERGSHQLRGVPEPVTLYRIVRASGAGRRAGQRHLTPFVGREEEIAMLMRRWERARQSEGQLVQIIAEPGLGKSRLIEEFHNRLRETPHTWVEWSCSQLLQNTALHPITEWGRQRFGGGDVSAELRLADLETSLAQAKLDAAENVPLLAPLLDIPLPPERTPTSMPEELRRRQLAALLAWVMAGARVQPVVLALEDVHWADPTTLDLFRGIAERGALAPLFVLITGRPEFRQPWGARSHHGTISLVPLDRQQVRDMVSGLGAQHALSKEVVEGVTERTGGVPLFVEELTRLLLERREQGTLQAIPPTLQQSLTARLDRLGSARDVAQIGAVIGRGFSYALLRAVVGTEDTSLEMALERLAEADILLVQGLPPSSDYRFKHALIQDAAYENLLKSRRQNLHRRVAEVLLDQFPATAAAEPELLAHHFTQAGLTESAVEWWGKAGERSLQRSALVEGIGQLTRALALIVTLPATPALRRQAINFNVALITPLYHVKGAAASETKIAAEQARVLIEEAEALGESPEDPLLLFSVLYGFWVANLVAFNGEVVRELSSQFLALAEKQSGTVPLMVGHRLKGVSVIYEGKFIEARTHLDRAVALYSRTEHGLLARQFGQDIRVAALVYLSFSWWFLGHADAALAVINQATRDAREIGDATTLMYALGHAALVHTHAQKYEAAEAEASEVIALANEKASPFWVAFGTATLGAVSARTGKPSDAVQIMTSGLAMLASTGTAMWRPFYLSCLAAAYADLAQFDDAWCSISEAVMRLKRRESCGAKRTFIELPVKLLAGPPNWAPRKRKHISSARSRSHASSRPSPWNSAPQ